MCMWIRSSGLNNRVYAYIHMYGSLFTCCFFVCWFCQTSTRSTRQVRHTEISEKSRVIRWARARAWCLFPINVTRIMYAQKTCVRSSALFG